VNKNPDLDRLGEISLWQDAKGNLKVDQRSFWKARHLLTLIKKNVPAARPPIVLSATPRGGIWMVWKSNRAHLQVEVGSKGTIWALYAPGDVTYQEWLPASEERIVGIIRDHFFYATGWNGDELGEHDAIPN
jgi:hypothetical protein